MTRTNRVTDLCRNVLMSGEGLRPVLRYARKSPVNVVRVDISVNDPTRYAVTFYYDDGAQCVTSWADANVLVDWLIARRSWSFHRLNVAAPYISERLEGHVGLKLLHKRGVEVHMARHPESVLATA